MTNDLMRLYQQVLLDHNQNPRHFGDYDAKVTAKGENPLCGDSVVIYLDLDEEKIERLGFTGESCAICRASASLMCEQLTGALQMDVSTVYEQLITMLTEDGEIEGPLEILKGVRGYPVRIKCAILPWNTLLEGLQGGQQVVSTE